MFFFYIIKLIFIDYLTFKLEIKYILQTIHFFTYETSLKEIQWQDTKKYCISPLKTKNIIYIKLKVYLDFIQ